MSEIEKTHCEHCGAKLVDNTFKLSRVHIGGLIKLSRFGNRPTKVGQLGLTSSQYSNWAQNHYWNFIEQENHRDGTWWITTKGVMFLSDELTVPMYAITFRGKVVGYEGPETSVKDIGPDLWLHDDYRRRARPHKFGDKIDDLFF